MFKKNKKTPLLYTHLLANIAKQSNRDKDFMLTNALVRFVMSVTERAEKGEATSAEIAVLPEVAQVAIKELRSVPPKE